MRRAAEGHLTTEALMWNQNNQKTISGMSSEDFRFVFLLAFLLSPPFFCLCGVLWRNFVLLFVRNFPCRFHSK